MSFSDSAAANAANPHGTAQDAQKLIALLGNLMPLLLRIQAQGGEAFGPFAQPNLMLDNPLIDQQAATNLVEDITAESLRTLSAYLDIYASRFPGLDNCVTIVTQAAHRLKARLCAGLRADLAGLSHHHSAARRQSAIAPAALGCAVGLVQRDC
jgi:hypothetical protein